MNYFLKIANCKRETSLVLSHLFLCFLCHWNSSSYISIWVTRVVHTKSMSCSLEWIAAPRTLVVRLGYHFYFLIYFDGRWKMGLSHDLYSHTLATSNCWKQPYYRSDQDIFRQQAWITLVHACYLFVFRSYCHIYFQEIKVEVALAPLILINYVLVS